MFELTTPAGTINASSEVELASRWVVLELGGEWDAECGPHIEHTPTATRFEPPSLRCTFL